MALQRSETSVHGAIRGIINPVRIGLGNLKVRELQKWYLSTQRRDSVLHREITGVIFSINML